MGSAASGATPDTASGGSAGPGTPAAGTVPAQQATQLAATGAATGGLQHAPTGMSGVSSNGGNMSVDIKPWWVLCCCAVAAVGAVVGQQVKDLWPCVSAVTSRFTAADHSSHPSNQQLIHAVTPHCCREIEYADLQLQRQIGEGSFGRVYLAKVLARML